MLLLQLNFHLCCSPTKQASEEIQSLRVSSKSSRSSSVSSGPKDAPPITWENVLSTYQTSLMQDRDLKAVYDIIGNSLKCGYIQICLVPYFCSYKYASHYWANS